MGWREQATISGRINSQTVGGAPQPHAYFDESEFLVHFWPSCFLDIGMSLVFCLENLNLTTGVEFNMQTLLHSVSNLRLSMQPTQPNILTGLATYEVPLM